MNHPNNMTEDTKALRERFPFTAPCQYNVILQILPCLCNWSVFLRHPDLDPSVKPQFNLCHETSHILSHVPMNNTSIQSVKWTCLLFSTQMESKQNSRKLGKNHLMPEWKTCTIHNFVLGTLTFHQQNELE